MAIWNLRALLFSWLSSFENCATILTQAILTSFDPYQSLVWLFPSFHVAFPPGQKPLGQGCGLSFNRWYAVYTWSWSGTISNFCESEYPFGKTLSYKEYRKKEKKKKPTSAGSIFWNLVRTSSVPTLAWRIRKQIIIGLSPLPQYEV